MSETKYTYSISQDFPNQKVDSSRLTLEIQESTIKVALDFIGTDGDACDIWFKNELDGADQSILSTVVANHSGEPLPENPQPVEIKASDVNIPIQEKDFPDFSGYPFFATSAQGEAVAGQTSHFYLSFDKVVRIQGGGFKVGDAVSPGDYVVMDMTYGEGGPVVGSFVEKMYVWSGREWEKILPDSKEIPVDICLRLSYISTGDQNVQVYVWYDMRRTPDA